MSEYSDYIKQEKIFLRRAIDLLDKGKHWRKENYDPEIEFEDDRQKVKESPTFASNVIAVSVDERVAKLRLLHEIGRPPWHYVVRHLETLRHLSVRWDRTNEAIEEARTLVDKHRGLFSSQFADQTLHDTDRASRRLIGKGELEKPVMDAYTDFVAERGFQRNRFPTEKEPDWVKVDTTHRKKVKDKENLNDYYGDLKPNDELANPREEGEVVV